MPALPPLLRQATPAAAADSRILDSRQLGHAVQTLATHARQLIKRIPELIRRQDQAVCQAGYIEGCYAGINAGPSPGAVVGIVLGSVFGFLLIMWLLFMATSGTPFLGMGGAVFEEERVETVRRSSRSPRSRRSHRSSYHNEMRHNSPRRERVVRQERIVRDVQPPRAPSRIRERDTIIVEEERRVPGDDIVEVIEEHESIDAPPRRKTRRSSGYRSVLQPSPVTGGYRRIDPVRFAGGDYPQHRVTVMSVVGGGGGVAREAV